MLVFTRKPGQKVAIGDDVTLTVVEIQGRRVTLALQAPDTVQILRGELVDEVPEPYIVFSREPFGAVEQPGL